MKTYECVADLIDSSPEDNIRDVTTTFTVSATNLFQAYEAAKKFVGDQYEVWKVAEFVED